jgi:hypothetical protein
MARSSERFSYNFLSSFVFFVSSVVNVPLADESLLPARTSRVQDGRNAARCHRVRPLCPLA